MNGVCCPVKFSVAICRSIPDRFTTRRRDDALASRADLPHQSCPLNLMHVQTLAGHRPLADRCCHSPSGYRCDRDASVRAWAIRHGRRRRIRACWRRGVTCAPGCARHRHPGRCGRTETWPCDAQPRGQRYHCARRGPCWPRGARHAQVLQRRMFDGGLLCTQLGHAHACAFHRSGAIRSDFLPRCHPRRPGPTAKASSRLTAAQPAHLW